MEEEKRSKFKRICVFCGSSSGNKPSYQEASTELGKKTGKQSKNFLSSFLLIIIHFLACKNQKGLGFLRIII